MCKSSLRHTHDPVLLLSKVEVICLSHLPYVSSNPVGLYNGELHILFLFLSLT